MTTEVYTAMRKATALVLLTVAGCSPPFTSALRLAETRRLMGVPWTITVCAADKATGRAAIAAGFTEVERLERVLSDYDPESELSRLSALAPMAAALPVSPDLWRVLEQAVALRDQTGGSFDPAIGRLTTLWRQARRSERLPVTEKVNAALTTVGPDALVLDSATRGVRLPKPGTRLDLGGIGMGYAADRALEAIAAAGVAAAMIDASGDVAVSDAPPGTAGWRIVVAPLGARALQPSETLLLVHAAVTTSGDAFQAVEIDGRRYSHIVDPRTGLGVAGSAAVTVIAPDCTTADALATTASVLGPAQGLALVAATPDCAARFIWQDGDTTRTATTPSWPAHLARSPAAPSQP
jgi:thiamine biosynthesis lipoprotein